MLVLSTATGGAEFVIQAWLLARPSACGRRARDGLSICAGPV
jgi:hypothetical protein